MGEVFRARDTKLGRDVALKVLPAAFAHDPERLARLRREAQVLASLNHPNIAAIHGLEETDGVVALALELVEGEDLAERLKRGAIPIGEAVAIAQPIAEALEEAHEKGIVHRDLKPANVMLTPDGKVKVLDFGLAKAYAGEVTAGSGAELSRSPTLTHTGTQAGVILGTAGYMSPEQARGKAVDKRADIWAFGVVFLEMLTGRPVFRGGNVTETLAAVIRDEPDLDALGPDVPAGIRRLIERCLEKDPRERLRDIGDARHEIEAAREGEPGPASPPAARAHGLGSVLPWSVAAILAVTTVAGWLSRSDRKGDTTPLRRFAVDLPWHAVPNWTDFDAALSPRGTHFAYYGRRNDGNDVDAYVRALDGLEAVPLGDAREADALAFSPDGEWLVVGDHRGLRKVSIHGGLAQPLARLVRGGGFGVSWGLDGSILVGHSSGLLRAPSSGGPVETLTRANTAAGETGHLHPSHLPGGTHALMTVARGEVMQLGVVDLARATYRTLPLMGSQAAYSASGHVVFRQGASVLAARFDPAAMAVIGEAVPVLEKVRSGPLLAADGTMLYVPERGDSNARLVWVDRTGRATPIPGERLDYSHLAIDASGRQALLNISPDVYVRDLAGGTRRLLASGGASFPIWSRDARWATYATVVEGMPGIVRHPADGSASALKLHTAKDLLVPTSWNSRTGDLAFFDQASDIWILPPGGTARSFLATAFNERSGRFSPDGRWLAYVSNETGSYQVYVMPYPGPGPKVAVSVEGGLEPIWSGDGRELFFRRGGRVLAAAMTFTPTLAAGPPVELFSGPYTLDLMGHQRWDVAPDGRFLMVENSDDFRIVLVQNWALELNRLVPREGTP